MTKLPERKLENWLHGLAQYVEETESPREFWLWSGIFCFCTALQRRCWLPYGIDNIYPNIYIMTVAPPGWSRKGPPVGFAKKILQNEGVQIPVFVDSPTKRALTKELDQLSGQNHVRMPNEDGTFTMRPQSPIALVSKELSSFLAVDPKGMVEVLTDLFDSHDVWEYKTSEKGADKIYGVCVNCYFATTPTYIANNLPITAVGDGFISRFNMVYRDTNYKSVPIPDELNGELYSKLVHDLMVVSQLVGGFSWGKEAKDYYSEWYNGMKTHAKAAHHDARVLTYLARIHIHVLKVAMALQVSRSNELVLGTETIRQAIGVCEALVENIPKAYGVFAASQGAKNTHDLLVQLRVIATKEPISFTELFKINYTKMNRIELDSALQDLEAMGQIKRSVQLEGKRNKEYIQWIGKRE